MKKVLVVVDMQNDFIDGPLGNDQTKAVVKNVVEKIKNFDGDLIVLTMDSHSEAYMETQEGKKLPVEHCIVGTDGWSINTEVRNSLNNFEPEMVEINCKRTFGSVSLPKGIEDSLGLVCDDDEFEIEICGICTGICVISNAMLLKAHFREAKIAVDASCCACVTPESHKIALEAMKMCQIDVIGENE